MLYNYSILSIIILWLVMLIFILLSIAEFTVVERQILGGIQRRQGPNVIGFAGILQAIADGVKLILKETVVPRSADLIVFIVSPIFTFALALCLWVVVPLYYGYYIVDFEFGILYMFTISSLGVHSVIMAGWSSNSKYAFLGALRSAAQMISYEIALGLCIVAILLLTKSLNLSDIIMYQKGIWYIYPLLIIFFIFFICTLAETNRHPFDLPEAESELVSGYNVEYAAIGFALFFLAEYSNIIVMSKLSGLLFLGGWFLFWTLNSVFITVIKTFFFMFLFVLVRATIPRYRYDQLMRLGWKVFLPITLAYVMCQSYIIFII